ncbi:MAG: hypothetical protein NUV45_14865 [Tepidanaerobacteraceae bacterium]|jgi:hypothetical protein|nr:hypothetical protein [Tepidanaerobacteraceae bacterium]
MHFTIHHDEQIDKKVRADLDLIKDEVLAFLGEEVHSILLCGGFGRGEGSVVVQNGLVRVVNDYDISIVLKERNRLRYAILYKRYHDPLNALAERLAHRLGMKQIDLCLKHLSYFDGDSALKIENYEVLKGHVLLYGEEEPCDAMPDWQPQDMPLFEGTWLFRNRGGGLLLAARYFMGRDGIPDDKRENFVIECGKAQLAMGDSLLLLNRCYHHLYSERLRIIDSMDVRHIPMGERILAHYREALEQKLQPDFERFYRRDLISWWFEIVELFDIFYKYFESRRLGVSFDNWIEYAELRKPEDQLDWHIWAGGLVRGGWRVAKTTWRRRNLLKARKSGFIAVMALLLFSAERHGFNGAYMERAAERLGVRLGENLENGWRHLTDIFFQTWHPAGEAGRVAKERNDG